MTGPGRVKIKDLRPHMDGITIVARVVSKSRVTVRRGKRYAYAIIEDETGRIKLNLWRDQVNQVEEGQLIRIPGAFVHVRGRVKQVSTWKNIEKVDPEEYSAKSHAENQK